MPEVSKNPLMKTPRERAEALLELHNGSCMAQQVSDVGKAFLQMEVEGLVKVGLAALPGMLTIERSTKEKLTL